MDWENENWAKMPESLKQYLCNNDMPVDFSTAKATAYTLIKQNPSPEELIDLKKWLNQWGGWLTSDEQRHLFEAIESSPKHTIRDRDLFILDILLKTGIKASEVVDLKVEDYSGGWIGVGNRKLPLNRDMQQKWYKYTMNKTGPLFSSNKGKQLTYITLARAFATHFNTAGLKSCTLSTLSRTFEQQLTELGINPVIIAALTGKNINLPWQKEFSENELMAAVESLDLVIKAPYRSKPYSMNNIEDARELFWKALPEYLLLEISRHGLMTASKAVYGCSESYLNISAEIDRIIPPLDESLQELNVICINMISFLQSHPDVANQVINTTLSPRHDAYTIGAHLLNAAHYYWENKENIVEIINEILDKC